ncbi:MAG: hypothetical protein ACNA7M_13705 [Roseovarius sp.]
MDGRHIKRPLRALRNKLRSIICEQMDVHSFHVDFSGICSDPLEARIRAPRIRHLLELPFDRLRDMHPIVPDWPSNPFVLTAQALLEDEALTFDASPLRSYFSHVIPESAAVIADGTSAQLRAMKAIEADLPWMSFGTPAVALKAERSIRQARENNVVLSFEDGDYAMGPVSRAKGELEFCRIRKVLKSIIDNGYHPSGVDGQINGHLIEHGEGWAVMIDSGTHRAACLYALKYTSVPVLIRTERNINSVDVDEWPPVKERLLTREEALAMFNRILRGDSPEWLDECWPPAARRPYLCPRQQSVDRH